LRHLQAGKGWIGEKVGRSWPLNSGQSGKTSEELVAVTFEPKSSRA